MKFVLSQGNILGPVDRFMMRNEGVQNAAMVHFGECVEIHLDGKCVAVYEDEKDANLAYKLLALWLSESDSVLLRKVMDNMIRREYGDYVLVMPTIESMEAFRKEMENDGSWSGSCY